MNCSAAYHLITELQPRHRWHPKSDTAGWRG